MLDALALPAFLDTRIGPIRLRRAVVSDTESIASLLADDPISASRGDTAAPADLSRYRAALEEILAEPSNDLLVAERDDLVVGTLQLTRLPGMARQGARRLLVEAVRVHSSQRSSGIGSAMMRWVTDSAAPALGTALIQLTSDAARVDAHRFYEGLGFTGSHVGFKLSVPPSAPSAQGQDPA